MRNGIALNMSRTLVLATLLTLSISSAFGQLAPRNDHVFAPAGGGLVTMATGIPYIGIGEVAWGISDRTTLGVLAGFTPFVPGYGVRVRTIVHQTSEFRVYFCTPVLYYPGTERAKPWLLTRPNINFEWVTESSFRYKVGASVIAAASQRSLFGGSPEGPVFTSGLWNAVHGGVSLPVTDRLMFQVEASAVLKGVRLAGSDWVGGPPVILVLGVAYRL